MQRVPRWREAVAVPASTQRHVRQRTHGGVGSSHQRDDHRPPRAPRGSGEPSAEILSAGGPELAKERANVLSAGSAGATDRLAALCVRHRDGRRLQCRRGDAGGWWSATLRARSRRRGRDPKSQRVAASRARRGRRAFPGVAARIRAATAAGDSGCRGQGDPRTTGGTQRFAAPFSDGRRPSRFAEPDDGHRLAAGCAARRHAADD